MTHQRLDLQNSGAGFIPTGASLAQSDTESTAKLSVQAARESRTMSLLDLAHRAGMLPQHIQAIEAGLSPNLPERQALAAALNVPVERLS